MLCRCHTYFLKSMKIIALLLAIFSYSSLYAQGDPDCLNVAFDAPLPDFQFKDLPNEPPQRAAVEDMLRSHFKKAEEHFLALKMADVVYALPDLEHDLTPAQFISEFQNFISKIPEGYRLYHAFSDPKSGLKYAIFAPWIERVSTPWILSLTGTETTLDWIGNASYGELQLRRLSSLFTQCLFQDSAGKPKLDRHLLITGHSLGGGLAQGLYHEIQRRLQPLLQMGYKSPLKLFTWNAFGGIELVQNNVSRRFNPQFIQEDAVFNYFVKGDIVSRIGQHIGPTYELVGRNPTENLGIKKAHVLKTMLEIAGDNPLISFLNPPQVDIVPIAGLAQLKKYAPGIDLLFFVPAVLYIKASITGKHTKLIGQTAELAAKIGPIPRGLPHLMKYLNVLSANEIERLGKTNIHAQELQIKMNQANKVFNDQLQVK